VLSIGYGCAAIAIALIGGVDRDPVSLTIVMFFCGSFVVGGQTGINALAGMIYPTGIRSTGVAWAFGIGRFGAMLGPVLGGLMIRAKRGRGGDVRHGSAAHPGGRGDGRPDGTQPGRARPSVG